MKRSRCRRICFRLGFIAFALLLAPAAPAAPKRALMDPRLVPPGADLVFSVPDLPAAWKALAATPIYQDLTGFLESPLMTGLPAWRRFLEQRRQMEGELGFPLDAASLAAMTAGFDFAIFPPTATDGPPVWVCVFRAADASRFGRLAQWMERRMETAARAAANKATPFERKDYLGVQISSTLAGGGAALAQLGPEVWTLSNHPQAIQYVIDQSRKNELLTGTLRFRAAVAGLVEPEPHGFLYLKSDPPAPGRPGNTVPTLPFPTLARRFREGLTLAADFRIEGGAVRFESFLPFADPARDPLGALYRHYPPGRLRSLDYVSSSPVVFTARNTLDGPALYEQLRPIVLASIGAVARPGETAEQRLRGSEESFAEQMGFALRDDLAPAIGPEAFASLEHVRYDPLQTLPTFDLVAGVQVRDAERMDRVVAGFEKFFERQLGSGPRPTSAPATLQTATYFGKTLKSFALPRNPQYSIDYARTDSFILVGLGGDSIRHAVDRVDGRRKPFSAGALYATLKPYLHEQANEVLVLNVPKVVALGREVLQRLPKPEPTPRVEVRKTGAPDPATPPKPVKAPAPAPPPDELKRIEMVLGRFGHVAAFGASTAGSELGLHTRGAVVFTPPEARKQPAK